MADKKPSFSERCERIESIAVVLGNTANMLLNYQEDLREEAASMRAAEKRFADRRSAKAKASR